MAVAMKHFGPTLVVVVEVELELVVLDDVVVLVTEDVEICTDTEVL